MSVWISTGWTLSSFVTCDSVHPSLHHFLLLAAWVHAREVNVGLPIDCGLRLASLELYDLFIDASIK